MLRETLLLSVDPDWYRWENWNECSNRGQETEGGTRLWWLPLRLLITGVPTDDCTFRTLHSFCFGKLFGGRCGKNTVNLPPTPPPWASQFATFVPQKQGIWFSTLRLFLTWRHGPPPGTPASYPEGPGLNFWGQPSRHFFSYLSSGTLSRFRQNSINCSVNVLPSNAGIWAAGRITYNLNIVPVHVMKAYRGSGSIAPLILHRSARWRWVVIHASTIVELAESPQIWSKRLI